MTIRDIANSPSLMTTKDTIITVDSEIKIKRPDELIIIDHTPTLSLNSKSREKKRPNYQISFKSRKTSWFLYNDAKLGDVLMATAYNIKHYDYVK